MSVFLIALLQRRDDQNLSRKIHMLIKSPHGVYIPGQAGMIPGTIRTLKFKDKIRWIVEIYQGRSTYILKDSKVQTGINISGETLNAKIRYVEVR